MLESVLIAVKAGANEMNMREQEDAKNGWSKVWLARRAQRLQPALWWSLGNASSKLRPCPALESRKWMRGGRRRDTVKGALPDDLGFAAGSQVIGYFLQGSWGNQPAQGGTKNGFRKGRGLLKLKAIIIYTRINSTVITQRQYRLAVKTGWRKRLGELLKWGR